MSGANWIQLFALVVAVVLVTRLLGPYLAKVFGGGTAPGDRFFLPVERAHLPRRGVDPEREQRWTTYALSLLAFSVVSVVVLYLLAAAPGRAAAEPDERRRPCRPRSRSTPRSASSRTRTGRTTRRVDDEPPHPDGRARGAQLRVGGGRRWPSRSRSSAGSSGAGSDDARQLLGRPRAHDDARPAAARVRVRARARQPGRGPEPPRPRRTSRPSQGATQTIPGGPVASQEAIKELGTNGGGPSTPTPRTRSRTRTPFTNILEISRSCCDPVRAHVHVRQDGRGPAAGLGVFAAMFVALDRLAPAIATALRGERQPEARRGVERESSGREHGGQGGALRRRRLRPVRGLDDRHVDGAVNARARQLHAARRRRAARRT